MTDSVRILIARLIVVAALLLMPLGMIPATTAQAHSPTTTAMPMRHCPDSDSAHHQNSGFADCTMACAGALPAIDKLRDEPLMAAVELPNASLVRQFVGVSPETATPPPKIS
jgi:hypothetical protein